MTSSVHRGEPGEEERPQPRAIVAGHGSFADGLVSAVQQISGCGDVFIALSNQGLGGPDIESRLRAASADSGARVFFTDLPAGSSTVAVRRIMRDDSGIVLITGANLATLLEFVFQPDADLGQAARNAAEKGRSALAVHGGS